jgi:hypothetical protein
MPPSLFLLLRIYCVQRVARGKMRRVCMLVHPSNTFDPNPVHVSRKGNLLQTAAAEKR